MASVSILIPPESRSVWNKDTEVIKDPSDVLDYTMSFVSFLQADTIATTTVTSKGVTVDSNSTTGNVVTVFVSGGNAGNIASVTIKITTTNATPRTFERSFRIRIQNR